jgi:hypothetical protein
MKTDVGWGQDHFCLPIFCQEITLDNKILKWQGARPALGFETFFLLEVPSWNSGSFTPHTLDYTLLNCEFDLEDPLPPGFEERNCLGSNNIVRESVFQTLPNHKFDPSVTYCIELNVQMLQCFASQSTESNIEVRSARQLVNSKGAFPVNADSELIGRVSLNSLLPRNITVSFTPEEEQDQNLWRDQLWIIADAPNATSSTTASISINNVKINCSTNALIGINTVELNDNTYRFSAIQNKEFATYSWSINNVSVNNNTNLLVHQFTEPGEYEVCILVTDEYGCCGIQCTNVNICEDLEVPQIEIVENYCSSYTFNIINVDPSASYNWNIQGGSPETGTGTQFCTHLPVGVSFYTISVTAQNECESVSGTANFSYECSLDSPSCLDQRNCVKIGIDMNSVTFLSDLLEGTCPVIPSTQFFFSYLVSNLCFSVEGRLIIDVPQVSFDNTNWFMGPGAEIEITPFGVWGSKTFTGSHFKGCTQMWRGIMVKANTPSIFGSGGVSFVRTTIEDAWRGVEIGNNSTFISDHCNFFDNYIGIHFPIQGQKQNHVEIKSTVFESTFDMLQPYPGQTSWKPITWKGIDVNNVNFVNIVSNPQEKNIFRNVEIGIWGSKSNINVVNAKFMNTSNFYYFSRGIVLNPVSKLSYIQQCDFRNLDKSIELKNGAAPGGEEQLGTVNILDNFFFFDKGIPTVPGTKTYGIESRGLTNYSINITNSNNFYYDCDYGHAIELVGTGGLSRFNIHDNDFIFNNGEEFTGIRITNHDFKSKIHENTFKRNGTATYYSAISLKDCSNVEVTNNMMDTDDEIEFAVGISYQGLNRCLFKNNQIWHPHVNGISGFGSSNTHILGFCCNTIPIPYPSNNRSIYFHGEFGESRIRQNTIFSLQLNGNFGVQQDAGNIWDGAGSIAEITNFVDAFKNRFVTDYNEIGAIPTNIIPSSVTSTWFQPMGLIPDCQTKPDCDIPPFNFQNDDPDLTDSGPNPQDPPIIIVDPARPTCSVIKDLYKRLENIDSLANPVAYWSVVSIINKWKIWKGEAWIQSCLDSIVSFNPDITPWNDAEKENDGVYKANQPQRQAMAPFMEDIIILTDSIMQIQLDSTLIMTSTDVQLYEDLEDALNLYQTGVNDYNQTMIDRATDLLPDLLVLPTPLPFLYDLKKVWIAEMKVVIDGTSALDSIEWGEIEEIALKCPLEFGQAVYDAQSLLQKINIDIETDLDCEFSTPRTKSSKIQSNEIIVTPNPGVGLFDFVWGKEMIGDQILLFNTNGEQVLRKSIENGQTKVSVDISSFMSGMYIWEIVFKNGLNQTGKIIKI